MNSYQESRNIQSFLLHCRDISTHWALLPIVILAAYCLPRTKTSLDTMNTGGVCQAQAQLEFAP